MYALSRDNHLGKREIILEKTGCFSSIRIFEDGECCVSRYDTVEILHGEEKTEGILDGYSYRQGGQYTRRKRYSGEEIKIGRKENEGKIISFCNVSVIPNKKISWLSRHFDSDVENNILIFIHPIRMVLIEKNFIELYEKKRNEYREWASSMPPMGG